MKEGAMQDTVKVGLFQKLGLYIHQLGSE